MQPWRTQLRLKILKDPCLRIASDGCWWSEWGGWSIHQQQKKHRRKTRIATCMHKLCQGLLSAAVHKDTCSVLTTSEAKLVSTLTCRDNVWVGLWDRWIIISCWYVTWWITDNCMMMPYLRRLSVKFPLSYSENPTRVIGTKYITNGSTQKMPLPTAVAKPVIFLSRSSVSSLRVGDSIFSTSSCSRS